LNAIMLVVILPNIDIVPFSDVLLSVSYLSVILQNVIGLFL
jgi:hypothetical protein